MLFTKFRGDVKLLDNTLFTCSNCNIVVILYEHIKIKQYKLTLMLLESVRNIDTLSMPIPQPLVGGNPYSNATQKPSSTCCASSSPAALSYAQRINLKYIQTAEPHIVKRSNHCTQEIDHYFEVSKRANYSKSGQ